MSKTITTSIRLDPDVRTQLEFVAQMLHRGKNWIINKALQEYLATLNHELLAAEAKRQSLLANKKDHEMSDWEEQQDDSGWI